MEPIWSGALVRISHEAIDAVFCQTYDLVLMDVQMPEMSGIEATREIRKRLPIENSPTIIALTANATTEDRNESMKAGMNDHMSKPIRVNELRRILENCQSKRKVA